MYLRVKTRVHAPVLKTKKQKDHLRDLGTPHWCHVLCCVSAPSSESRASRAGTTAVLSHLQLPADWEVRNRVI